MRLVAVFLVLVIAIDSFNPSSEEYLDKEYTLEQLKGIIGEDAFNSAVWIREVDELNGKWDVYRRMHNYHFLSNYMKPHVDQIKKGK